MTGDVFTAFKDETADIKRILAIPGKERTEIDIDELVYLIGNNPFLSKFKETGQLRLMCRHVDLREYNQNDVIVEKDTPGD